MKTNTYKAAGALIIIFILGFSAGYVFNNLVSKRASAQETPSAYSDEHRSGQSQARMQERRMQGQGQGRTVEEQEERIERARKHMREHLALEEDQAEPLFELIRESRDERRAIMNESRRSFRELMEQHDSEFHEQLGRILTEDQLIVWDSLYARSEPPSGNQRGRQ